VCRLYKPREVQPICGLATTKNNDPSEQKRRGSSEWALRCLVLVSEGQEVESALKKKKKREEEKEKKEGEKEEKGEKRMRRRTDYFFRGSKVREEVDRKK
jgi:hypothetical protein